VRHVPTMLGCMPARVLIVDDHSAFRDTVRALLTLRGFEVVGEAGNAASTLAAAAALVPDAVVLDVCLGPERGTDVARTLTRTFPELAVLLVSSEPVHASAVRESGARGFVEKSRLVDADLGALLG
jgi:DNA-binding NarL/FixJ family response regulator